nr:hypothetical protein [Tanacetum cinerariifolium]
MLLMEDSMLYSASSILMQHSSSSYDSGGTSSSVGNRFSSVGGSNIEHIVTRFDTLAGVAIKYGVEVADIKRMNGLTTDLQMFARKSLRIPSPGRFPPSPVISNGCNTQRQTSSEMTHPSSRYSDSFSPIRSLKLSASPQRNISSSINSLRDYYGLAANDQNGVGEGFGTTQTSPQPLGLHRKSKSEANGFSMISRTDKVPTANEKGASSDKSIEKLVRRRKSEVDLNNHTPEALFKSIELQPNTANVTSTEPEPGAPSMIPLGSRDSSMTQVFNGVRKSSSAPTFQQSETINNSNNSPPRSSIWLTSMLNFKADLQGLSISAITSPLFDGLPKPTSGRKNKAARD